MKGTNYTARIAVLLWTFGVVLIVAYFVWPSKSVTTTLGDLASKEPGQPAGPVYVSNCVGGSQVGRFYCFPSPHKSRHTVVFVLNSAEDIPPKRFVFTGHCEGICNFELAGCPVKPPFLLVTGVEAVP